MIAFGPETGVRCGKGVALFRKRHSACPSLRSPRLCECQGEKTAIKQLNEGLLRRQSISNASGPNKADDSSPAAAYVRMSTDHQKYSTENQLETIRRYAGQRGFDIAEVFEDSGRSGLRVDGREGLQRLMREVSDGRRQIFRNISL